ncbi:nuclease-related domain-containing DEAD/DEAH box helicase [Pantoea ananatis]|uniref:nuclease-related domain-containing DEAD/DEAH box helicase n=1 Tax=Pantoea ananas TaxID=553 RepID=UPI001B3176D2|nr:AAA family ATPase [Pantoea ananatis]
MAKMIPAFGPTDNNSYGEKTIYALLKDELPDDFTVIHSLPWLSMAAQQIGIRLPPSGEIDFLVLHQSYGVLAFEVKSGIYRVDGPLFIHIKTNTNVDVVKQTRNNAHGLARWLGGATTLKLRIGYGFIFPDSIFDNKILSPAMVDASVNPHKEIFIDKAQIPSIAKRTIDIMQYWKQALNNNNLGSDRIKLIIKTLCPEFDGTPSWGARIIYDNQLWLRLTNEQIKAIELLGEYQRFVVTGWPGTGKTLIGIEFARRLASEGKKVLFITFNNRLSEHINQQTKNRFCDVLTWHKLCHSARQKLDIKKDVPAGWFISGCCEDLLSALDKEKMGNYDALIVDEAQALQYQWLRTLSSWFENKRIIVFCDESQTFSFEKGTNHNDLQEIIKSQFTYNLTIVSRCPKAITDYLTAIKPASYQITSPRCNEPDTLKEYVVNDPIEKLIEEIVELKENSVSGDEITVLVTNDQEKKLLQDGLNTFQINVETVSRFRGMESPVVIAFNASNMEDAQLFCAYSRATTAFTAIYEAERLAWKEEHTFLKKLVSKQENQEAIKKANRSSLSKHLMRDFFTKENLRLNTIELSWSEELSSWLIDFDQENSPSETWIDYLSSYHKWPILYWFGKSRKTVYYISNQEKKTEIRESASPLSIEHCSTCRKISLLAYEKSCILCINKKIIPSPTIEDLDNIKNLDLIISQKDLHLPEMAYKRDILPIPLVAVRARQQAFEKSHSSKILSEPLPAGKLLYRSTLAIIQAWIVLRKPGNKLVLDEITDVLRNRFKSFEEVERAQLKSTLACALSTCFNKSYIIKNGKGSYSIKDE